MVKKQGRVSARLLQRIRDCVQRWYHDEGLVCAQVINFGNLDAGEVLCEVVEGEVTGVEYQFQDKLGNVVEGNTQQLRPGHIFNIGAGKQALKNINALGLFSNIEVNPRPDETKEGGVLVEIKLKEQDPKSVEVETVWNFVPGDQGRPTLASIQPGGGVTFEHRNICCLNRSLAGSFSSSNLLNPQVDVSFKLEYTHPYLDGVEDRSRNRIFKASCFNNCSAPSPRRHRPTLPRRHRPPSPPPSRFAAAGGDAGEAARAPGMAAAGPLALALELWRRRPASAAARSGEILPTGGA